MKSAWKIWSWVTVIAMTCSCAHAYEQCKGTSEYCIWLQNLQEEMVDKGISKKTVNEVFQHDFYKPKPEVVEQDRKQAEFLLTSDEYLNRIANKIRTEKAHKKYRELQPLLKKIEAKYEVQGEYLIAFWGAETNFGTNFGRYNIIEALVQLSYDKRRSDFFKKQLYEALKMIDTKGVSFEMMQGSWAGAMGHFQFMPTTFNAYAVDFDGDGKIDIWNSFEDAIASAANYLHSIGWNKQQPWGQEVKLSWNFDYQQTGRKKIKTVAEWKKAGVRDVDWQELKLSDEWQGAVITPEGRKGRAYLVLENFNKIMNWNRSENYALAIGKIAQDAKNGKQWQKVDKAYNIKLSSDDISTIQQFINKQKIAKVEIDGKLGTSTREAIKKLQRKLKITADGYPDYRLLERIKQHDNDNDFGAPIPPKKLHKHN